MITPPDMMILNRNIFTNRSTIGDLYIDGAWVCYILEPTSRDQGPNVIAAIPTGRYEVVMYKSPRMKRKVLVWKEQGIKLHPLVEAARVPLYLKVPGHDFVEMHPGNSPEDTKDCHLPGKGCSVDWVSNSVEAWIDVVGKIERKLKAGPFFIGVTGGEPKI